MEENKVCTSIPHFKNINKAEFTNGKYKKITIPYDQNLSVKYGVAEYGKLLVKEKDNTRFRVKFT